MLQKMFQRWHTCLQLLNNCEYNKGQPTPKWRKKTEVSDFNYFKFYDKSGYRTKKDYLTCSFHPLDIP